MATRQPAALSSKISVVTLQACEPTIPDDVAGHERIVREGGMPIATGENVRTLYEFRQFIAGGAVTYLEPDVSNCGGVHGAVWLPDSWRTSLAMTMDAGEIS